MAIHLNSQSSSVHEALRLAGEERGEAVRRICAEQERSRSASTVVELLLDQEHTVSSGQEVCSHLVAIPKGMEVPALLRAVFSLDIYGRPVERRAWQPISDGSITSQYPEHRVYWLCRARDHSAEWVRGVVAALLAPDAAAPKPREIKNRSIIQL